MAVGRTQPVLRKYLGALKDTTAVRLAIVNGDYKVMADSHCTQSALIILSYNSNWTSQLSRPQTMLSIHQRRSTSEVMGYPVPQAEVLVQTLNCILSLNFHCLMKTQLLYRN
jgi:hypothetical protein